MTISPSPSSSMPWWWCDLVVCMSSPAAAAASESGTRRTSWSASSKLPGTRRWSSWPKVSGRCWNSVPPKATLRTCMPRQTPSTGMSISVARRTSAISNASRSLVQPLVSGWGCGAVGRRVHVDAAGDDEAVDAVQEIVGFGHQLGLGGHHQRQAAGAAYLGRGSRRAGPLRVVPHAVAGVGEGAVMAMAGRYSSTGDQASVRCGRGPVPAARQGAQAPRNRARWTLPLAVLGRSVAKSTIRGYL